MIIKLLSATKNTVVSDFSIYIKNYIMNSKNLRTKIWKTNTRKCTICAHVLKW